MRHPPLRSDASFCPLGLIDKPTYPRDRPTLLNRLQRRYQSFRFNFLPRISRMNTNRTKTHRRAHHPCPSVPSVVKFGPGMFRIAVPNLSSGQNGGVVRAAADRTGMRKCVIRRSGPTRRSARLDSLISRPIHAIVPRSSTDCNGDTNLPDSIFYRGFHG